MRDDFQLIKRLLHYLRPWRFQLFFATLALVVAKGVEACIPFFLGDIVNQALQPSLEGPYTKLFSIFYQCGALFLAVLGVYAVETALVFVKNKIGQKGVLAFRKEIYAHIQGMPIAFYNTQRVGALMTRVIHDVDQVNQMFAESVIPLVGSLFLFVAVFIGLFFIHIKLGLLMLAILPFLLALTNYFRINQRRCYDRIRRIVSTMNAFVQEHLMGASTIRSFGLQEQKKEEFEKINKAHREANVETIGYFALFFAGIDFLQSFSLIAVFVLLVTATPASAPFDAGTFFTFSLYVMMLFRPLADLCERYNVLQSAMAAAARIFAVMDEPIEDTGPQTGPCPEQVDTIAFEDVWFAYKEGEWVLKGLSFHIRKGESLALVGVTGAGKTSVLNLLLRFYTHQKGQIKINGVPIEKIPLKALRRLFSVVLQDPEIFSGTFSENLSLYEDTIGSQQIQQAVEDVHLSSLIDRFPEGVEHVLTERGKSLSAGQRQLLSLGRAKAFDRSVFAFDEATANIDTATEKKIQAALKNILGKKTAIVIAHRLSTVKDVTKIVVLQEGRAIEEGSHEELLEKKGFYEKLYRLQFMGA